MFLAAAWALADCTPAAAGPGAGLLPALDRIRQVSRRIAVAVGAKAQEQGLAAPMPPAELERLVEANSWEPRYRQLHQQENHPR
jgi:malate dehydrogenase (oxaloacetate-decarboxylating)